MFRFTKKPASGSHSQCLAKITRSTGCGYLMMVSLKTETCWSSLYNFNMS